MSNMSSIKSEKGTDTNPSGEMAWKSKLANRIKFSTALKNLFCLKMKHSRAYFAAGLGAAFSLFSNLSLADEDPSLKITVGQEMATVNRIYKQLVDATKEKTESEMNLYTNTIPGTKVTYAMVPIK